MRSWGWLVEISLFVVDLFKAYNQMCNDERELWFNGGNWVDRNGNLKFATGLRTGFGGENAPHGFGAKVTRACNYSIDQSLDKSGRGYELQHRYRRVVKEKGMEETDDGYVLRRERGSAVMAAEDPDYEFITPRETRQISREEKKREFRERLGDWPWKPLIKKNDLTCWEPLLEPGPSVSAPGKGKTYCVGTYLDDVFGCTH